MEHQAEVLKNRTKQFALRILRVIRSLPPGPEGKIIGHQLLRSGMSVAANYRAACRARSRPDESEFWLEMVGDAGLLPERKLKDLMSEANQLVAIFNASRTTAKKGVQSAINNQQSTIPGRRVS
jgi:hypothetical protein